MTLAALCLGAAVFAIDGDTLKCNGVRLRIWGIDAPESHEVTGPPATGHMAFLLSLGDWQCVDTGARSYGRIVARCDVLACTMIGAGHAKDWPRYSGGAYREC